VNPAGMGAYPILTYSWILMRRNYPRANGPALKSFVSYALGDGQKLAADAGYLPLPAHVAALAREALASVDPEELTVVEKRAEKPVNERKGETGAEPPHAQSPQTGKGGFSATLSAEPLAEPSSRTSYRVATRESIRDVAVKVYRDPDQWVFIAAVNPGVDPTRRVRIGQVLKLP
jgi:hypothetical protein